MRYFVLARILTQTRHNIVITTNFDNLVQDALNAIGTPRSFIAHSPDEARFIHNHSDKPRILGAFNEPVKSWLDFFMFTMFTDRDGKFQL